MSHGYAGEGEAFFRGWALQDVPADFSFVSALRDESGELAIVKRYGMELLCRIGDELRENPEKRRALVASLRQDYWWVRNARWNSVSPEDLAQREDSVIDACCLLEVGGMSVRDIVMTAQCLQARCVCNGCDCWNGDRAASVPADSVGPSRGR